jgi:hypothetical protein
MRAAERGRVRAETVVAQAVVEDGLTEVVEELTTDDGACEVDRFVVSAGDLDKVRGLVCELMVLLREESS